MVGRPKSTHCKYGHEIAVVGRYSSGSCRGCRVTGNGPYRRGNAPATVCKRGHSLVGNRVMRGGRGRECLTCHREAEARRRAKATQKRNQAEIRRERSAVLKRVVPMAPLLELMSRRGIAIRGLGRMVEDRMGVNGNAMERLMHRSALDGWMSVVAADEVCVALGTHPVEVWGTDWFTYGAKEVADAV